VICLAWAVSHTPEEAAEHRRKEEERRRMEEVVETEMHKHGKLNWKQKWFGV